MKLVLFIIGIIVLMGCPSQSIPTTPAYFLFGQSNACSELGNAMQDNTSIKVIQAWKPGHPIEHWFTETKQYYTEFDEQIISESGYYPEAIFWFQGEQNCYDDWTQDKFSEYTANLFNYIQKAYPGIDINIFQLGYTGVNPEVLKNIEIIRGAQEGLNNTYPGVIISTQSYDRRDAWHLSAEGYTQLGADIIELYEQ